MIIRDIVNPLTCVSVCVLCVCACVYVCLCVEDCLLDRTYLC